MPVDRVLEQAIMNGRFDASLNHLATLIQQRREIVASQLAHSLQPGDRVRYNRFTRPQYLRRREGTVVYTSGNKVYVRIDTPIGKYHPDRPIGTPATLLDRV